MFTKSILTGLLALGVAAQGAHAQVSAAPERGGDKAGEAMFAFGPLLDYSSGKFGGTESTDIRALAVTGRFQYGRLTLRATVPYLDVSGPGNVVPTSGGAGVPVCRQERAGGGARTGLQCAAGSAGTTSSSTFNESGVGDVTVGAGYTVVDGTRTTLDLVTKIKIPTADEKKALGTGQFDYSLQADVYQAIGQTTAFATGGYRWYGDPVGIDIKDGVFAAVGATYAVTSEASLGLGYDFRQATYEGGPTLNEVSLLAAYRFSTAARVRGYLFKGLTDGGPDWGAGVSALFSF